MADAPSIETDLLSDDPRTSLNALRRKLAADLMVAEPSVSAQIAGQLRQVLTQLAALPKAEGSVVDELADRRSRNDADAGVALRPARRTRQRRAGSG